MSGKIIFRELGSPEDMEKVEELQGLVWAGDDLEIVPAHILVGIAHNGGVAIGAFEEDRLVGFVLGFLGTDQKSPNRVAMARLKHVSHMLGVHPDYRDSGIGFQLKLKQRERVVRQGIRLATWTYDPLQSRNAHLNIRRLGSVCRTYIRNMYGELRDDINRGMPSDRFQVEWWLTSSRVQSRVDEARKPLDLAHYLGAGARKVNQVILGEGDLLHPDSHDLSFEGMVVLVEIPPNFEHLHERDLGLAKEWRYFTREIFERAFEMGYLVTDFVYLRGEEVPRAYYILSYGESTLGA